jgi:hydroxymethylpyrimidine/phosphomethylpyrimidine kinase
MKGREARPAVLCIGGLDPSGGAGLLADAESVRAAGGRALVAITAITVQTRRGVTEVAPVAPVLLVAQVERLFSDELIGAVKLGMLGNAGNARWLARILSKRLRRRPLVIDPVLRSTSGAVLFRGRALKDYSPLFAVASVLTPNLPEAEELVGHAIGEARSEREHAAQELQALTGCAIVLKGGHAPGNADDLVVDGREVAWLAGKRVAGSRRGTGCRFASALAVRLTLGDDVVEAARGAKWAVRRYLTER